MSEGRDSQAQMEAARAGIDAVDDEIHALLIRRAEHVGRIASAKGGGGGAYRPAREARILRRLLEANRAPLDFAVVYRLWREMIGGFTAMQAPLRVSVPHGSGLGALARAHFGGAALIGEHRDTEALAEAMAADDSLLALVEPQGWRICADGEGRGGVRVIAALPFDRPRLGAFCVARSDPQESGADRTLFAVAGATGAPASLETIAEDEGTLLVSRRGFSWGDEAMVNVVAEACGTRADAVACLGAWPEPLEMPR